MRLHPTSEKIQIKWFVYSGDTKMRYESTMVHFRAWDASCSCGWQTVTGGAIRASVLRDVNAHKIQEHGYSYKAGA